MPEGDDGFDPFIDPASRWENDYTPDMYNENLQVLGSNFVFQPGYEESGLERELGAGAKELLESEDKANIADLLVDSQLWESRPNKPERIRNEYGWYAIDFRMEGDDTSYQGFLRPVDDLGWDVVIQKHGSSSQESISAGHTEDITVRNPGINGQGREKTVEEGNYYGHFLPYSI